LEDFLVGGSRVDHFDAASTAGGCSSSSSSSSETTAVPTTGAPDPSTSSSGDPTTGEPPVDTTGELPPETTCGDLIDCLPKCLMDPDIAGCLGMCTQGLPPEEAMNAIALGLCIGQGCFESGACSLDTIQDPICIACLGFGLISKKPAGCEDQADACNGR
jgi:hypothetical protein